jgi:hypothetical protein
MAGRHCGRGRGGAWTSHKRPPPDPVPANEPASKKAACGERQSLEYASHTTSAGLQNASNGYQTLPNATPQGFPQQMLNHAHSAPQMGPAPCAVMSRSFDPGLGHESGNFGPQPTLSPALQFMHYVLGMRPEDMPARIPGSFIRKLEEVQHASKPRATDCS